MDKDHGMGRKRYIIYACILASLVCLICAIVYKAQLEEKFDRAVRVTMMSEHKDTGTICIEENNPVVSEMFLCKVPELKQIYVECKGKTLTKDATLVMTLTDADTGEVYYQKEESVQSIVSGSFQKVRMKLDKTLRDSEDRLYVLTWELKNAGTSSVEITANKKYTLVTSTYGMSGDRNNIIYEMRYSNTKDLRGLYLILSGSLVVLAVLAYWLIVVRRLQAGQFYVPLAICFGLIMNAVVMIHGVPDEPSHLDTAYKLSNRLLFIEDTGIEGTLVKRACDVQLEDMLANGVESNSYYQLYHHTLERPQDTDLITVSYLDSSNLVPDIVFLPTAVGISIGRILGLSAILTLGFGRLFNLLAFVAMTGWAIKLIPYGKNVLAFVGLLPITIQQAASASYDAVVNGVLLLFIALSLRFSTEIDRKKWQIVLYGILAVLVAVMKGGVYIPILLLLLLYRETSHKKEWRKKRWIIGIAGIAIAMVVIFLAIKYYPTVKALLLNGGGREGGISIHYYLDHPLQLVYMYWNTVVGVGESHLRGLLGGLLGWADVKMNWMFLSVLLGSLLLLPNVEGDSCDAGRKDKRIMLVACLMSILVIMLSMLFGFTKAGQDHIVGIQGRYYIGIIPLLLLPSANTMIRVDGRQSRRIWMTAVLVELFIVVQFVVEVM